MYVIDIMNHFVFHFIGYITNRNIQVVSPNIGPGPGICAVVSDPDGVTSKPLFDGGGSFRKVRITADLLVKRK